MQPPVRKYKSKKKSATAALTWLLCGFLLSTAAVCAKDGPALRPIPESTTGIKKVESAPVIKPVKPSVKANSQSISKPEVKAETKVETKTLAKTEVKKAAGPRVVKHTQPRGSSMVPPPPPDTPSMLSDPSLTGVGGMYGMQVEYMSKDALKDRVKEISIQYKDASSELANRKASQSDIAERAKNFEQLFTEGVVSRRELETAQKDASGSDEDIARLESKCHDLKALLDRINKKLAMASSYGPKNLAVKKSTKKKKIVNRRAAK